MSYVFEEVPHTADKALHVQGNTLADLFEGAALGMFAIMADTENVSPTLWLNICAGLEWSDTETLFVSWLNELLYEAETQNMGIVSVRIQDIRDDGVVANVGLAEVPFDGARIKSATFNDLQIRRTPLGYETTVVLDV